MTLTAVTNAKTYDWQTWMLGIMRSFLTGGGAALVSGLAAMGVAPNQINLTTGLMPLLKVTAASFLVMGLFRMGEFLTLHGAPDQLGQTLQVAADATAKASDAIATAKTQADELPKP